MTWREIREADLPACLALQPGNLGDEIVGRETAVRIWKRLLGDRAFRGIVIEDGSARSGSRIIGVGAGVFVRPDFMTAEIGNPRPGGEGSDCGQPGTRRVCPSPARTGGCRQCWRRG